jgi:nuclear transport factor 2 (NTF2) superfamily protein
MKTEKKSPLPPWDMDSAAKKLQLLADAWNTLEPEKVAAFYTENAEVRYGTDFLTGHEEFRQFLTRLWQQQLGFKLELDLWGALKGRMAVRFAHEWHDAAGKAYKGFGVQVFQFNDDGYIEMNFASYNNFAL